MAFRCVICPAPLQIDPEIMGKLENPPAPLLEIQLELVAPDIVWKPDLSESPDQKVGVSLSHCIAIHSLQFRTALLFTVASARVGKAPWFTVTSARHGSQ